MVTNGCLPFGDWDGESTHHFFQIFKENGFGWSPSYNPVVIACAKVIQSALCCDINYHPDRVSKMGGGIDDDHAILISEAVKMNDLVQ